MVLTKKLSWNLKIKHLLNKPVPGECLAHSHNLNIIIILKIHVQTTSVPGGTGKMMCPPICSTPPSWPPGYHVKIAITDSIPESWHLAQDNYHSQEPSGKSLMGQIELWIESLVIWCNNDHLKLKVSELLSLKYGRWCKKQNKNGYVIQYILTIFCPLPRPFKDLLCFKHRDDVIRALTFNHQSNLFIFGLKLQLCTCNTQNRIHCNKN